MNVTYSCRRYVRCSWQCAMMRRPVAGFRCAGIFCEYQVADRHRAPADSNMHWWRNDDATRFLPFSDMPTETMTALWIRDCITSVRMKEMPITYLCNFQQENIENVAANRVQNLTVIGQRFAEISRNEVSVSKTMLLWTTRVSLPNGISFRSLALTGCTSVTDNSPTYRRTDHAMAACVAIGGIAFSNAA